MNNLLITRQLRVDIKQSPTHIAEKLTYLFPEDLQTSYLGLNILKVIGKIYYRPNYTYKDYVSTIYNLIKTLENKPETYSGKVALITLNYYLNLTLELEKLEAKPEGFNATN